MRVRASGAELNVRVDGREGAPWVVLSNSLATDLTLWDGQAAWLARDFRVLRYDTRGHGRSEATPEPYSFRMLAEDVVAVMDAVGAARAHFVGLSIGGMIGMALALDRPERVDRLVLCAARAEQPTGFRQAWEDRFRVVRERGMDALVEPTIERWFTPGFRAGAGASELDRIRAMIRATSPAGYLGCGAAILTLDFLPRLGAVRAPTLVMAGAQDGGAPPAALAQVQRAIPGSRYAELDPCGHILNVEQRTAFDRALAEFLGRP